MLMKKEEKTTTIKYSCGHSIVTTTFGYKPKRISHTNCPKCELKSLQ